MFWAAIEIITIFQNIRSMGQKKSFSTLLPPCSISWEPNSRWKLSRLSSIHWSRGRSKSYLKKFRTMFLILFKFYIQFLIIQGELERNLKWLIKEYCFMKLNFRIFSDTTMSFGRLRETIFFPLGAWCVCVLFSLHFRRNFLNVTQFLTWSYQWTFGNDIEDAQIIFHYYCS